jgi:hypothetical protein
MLVDEGTTLVKIFRNLSKEEQRVRLQERIDDPEKRSKFRRADFETRALFDEYVVAYEEAITQTSTHWARWHVVPADRNWVKSTAVATLLVRTLERFGPEASRPRAGHRRAADRVVPPGRTARGASSPARTRFTCNSVACSGGTPAGRARVQPLPPALGRLGRVGVSRGRIRLAGRVSRPSAESEPSLACRAQRRSSPWRRRSESVGRRLRDVAGQECSASTAADRWPAEGDWARLAFPAS